MKYCIQNSVRLLPFLNTAILYRSTILGRYAILLESYSTFAMRLLNPLPIVAGVTAILQGVGVWAYPGPNSTGLVASGEDDYHLESRAPPVTGSTAISLESIKPGDTVIAWAGYQEASGMAAVAKTRVSDEAMRETAYRTWKLVDSSLQNPAIVSVIHVPGCGWAAGSVWHGTADSFEAFTRNAPIFWNSVPGEEQGLNRELNGKNQWHAEAVATAKAELEFGHLFQAGAFPEHTKIITYGRYWKNNKLITDYKPACTTSRSQVNVACEAWLDRLSIEIVGREECK